MKTLFALALALTTAASANAAVLVKAQRMPGFEMNPESRVFTLDTSGRMILVVHSYRTNQDQTIELGTLSRYSVDKIDQGIKAIPADAKLVDNKEGQPMCTDTPSYSTSVLKDGRSVEIYRSGGCHEWNLSSYAAQEAKALASAFLEF